MTPSDADTMEVDSAHQPIVAGAQCPCDFDLTDADHLDAE